MCLDAVMTSGTIHRENLPAMGQLVSLETCMTCHALQIGMSRFQDPLFIHEQGYLASVFFLGKGLFAMTGKTILIRLGPAKRCRRYQNEQQPGKPRSIHAVFKNGKRIAEDKTNNFEKMQYNKTSKPGRN